MSWVPIAKHGQTAAAVRAALHELGAQAIDAWRRARRADGWPEEKIQVAVAFAERRQAEQIALDLPLIVRDLTGGTAALH